MGDEKSCVGRRGECLYVVARLRTRRQREAGRGRREFVASASTGEVVSQEEKGKKKAGSNEAS